MLMTWAESSDYNVLIVYRDHKGDACTLYGFIFYGLPFVIGMSRIFWKNIKKHFSIPLHAKTETAMMNLKILGIFKHDFA